jgi:hypothetical protein
MASARSIFPTLTAVPAVLVMVAALACLVPRYGRCPSIR